MELTPDKNRLFEIFHPFAFERATTVRSHGTRFVHYTRADAAMNILRTKQFWMRKTSCMDDFLEVEYGLQRLLETYHGEQGKRFKAALESMFQGITKKIEELFDGWKPYFQKDTYITCFSEHRDKEDTFGRLSMWRTYRDTTGVALVVNNVPFLSASNALKVSASPVAYLTNEEFEKQFKKIVHALETNSEFLGIQNREVIDRYVFNSLRFAVLCTKHPGFKEEKEWRVIYTPKIDKSDRLIKDIQVIGGVPQPIYRIPLQNVPQEGLFGVEIPELINRIIIGPTQYPSAAREAFEDVLSEVGVDDPAGRIFVSDIPLR